MNGRIEPRTVESPREPLVLSDVGYGTRLRPERPKPLKALLKQYKRSEAAEQAALHVGIQLASLVYQAEAGEQAEPRARWEEHDRRYQLLVDQRNEAWDRLAAASRASKQEIVAIHAGGPGVGNYNYRLRRAAPARPRYQRRPVSGRTAPRRRATSRTRRAARSAGGVPGDAPGSADPPGPAARPGADPPRNPTPPAAALLVCAAAEALGFAVAGALAATVAR